MKAKILIHVVLISLFLSSCIVYHPQTIDIPLISHKNDLRIDAGVSILPTVNTTISYGLTDKIALQGFGSYNSDDHYYFQAASGLYKNKGNNRILELYSGMGYGYGNAYNDANPGNLLGNYQLYFAQLNYGKIASETSNFEIGVGLKSGYLHSNLTDHNYYDMENRDNFTAENPFYQLYQDESILIEPAGVIRFGGENLRFSIKLASTWIYKFTNRDHNFPYSHFNLGLGINYRVK